MTDFRCSISSAAKDGASIRPTWVVFAAVAALFAGGCSSVKAPPGEAPATSAVAAGAYDDDPRAPTEWETAVIVAGKDTARLSALERELLVALQEPQATPAEAQDAAEHLGHVLLVKRANPDSPSLLALGRMLTDESLCGYARLALDRVPGEAVDAVYVNALKSARGSARLGLIQSIGARKIAGAVPILAAQFGQADPVTAAATASALGQIGGHEALVALAAARQPLAPAVLNARLLATATVDADTAARTAEAILRNPDAPLPQRSAALRCLIGAKPAAAANEIHATLLGTEPALHQVAIEAVATLPAPGAAAELAGKIGAYAPQVQVALIAALGSRGDAGAIPGVLGALEAADSEVRLAALDALGRLPGDSNVAQRLATIASGSGAEARAAAASLARLDGAGVDDLVRAGAAKGDVRLRAVFIQQIAARNLADWIPFLFSLRDEFELPLRVAALDALREIAPPAEQRAVIDWALGAKEKSEQARAVRTLITIILRDDAADTRASTVVAALDAGDAAARVALLPVLSRIGGAQAFAAAGRLARSEDASVAAAAVAELARWPDASARPVLVDIAATATSADVRNAAVRGAADFLSRSEGVSRDERKENALRLLALPVGSAEQNALLQVLSLCSDQAALDAARRFLAIPETAEAARDAVDAITSNLAGPPDFKASNATEDLAKLSDGDTATSWSVSNTPGEWLFADLKHSRPVRKLTLDQGPRGWGFPAEVEVFVSDDSEQQGEVRAQAEGERGKTIVTLPAGVRGRYVWIRQTGTRDPAWTIAELAVE